MRIRRILGLASSAIIVTALPLAAQQSEVATPSVFRRFANRVIRIQVSEAGSGAKAVVGSGFFVDDAGHLLTNFHVVADVVQHPDRYRIAFGDGQTPGDSATILAIDVIHDLAVLQTPPEPRPHFTLATLHVHQGDRLYSLGYPEDLGLAIVEGTYNGLLKHTLYPKLHFTGSLNPGMSGGPTITADGRVVGINVSTAGNQLSFLVPASDAVALVARATAPGYRPPARMLDDVAHQMMAYQDVYLNRLFTDSTKTVDLGPYRVPTEPAPFFRCWGDAPDEGNRPYVRTIHRCSTDDQVYLASDESSGVVELTHELLTSTSLSVARFYALYTQTFGRDNTPSGDEDEVTSWRCATRNLTNGTMDLRTVVCLRAYRKLAGLYDGVIKVAALGQRRAGLVSTLTLSGASFSNIQRLTTRFLREFRWH